MRRAVHRIITTLAVVGASACGQQGESAKDVSAQSPNASPATQAAVDPLLAHGQATYDKFCTQCHGADLKGYIADNAPSLVSETFLASASAEFLRTAIEVGRPGTAMGAYADVRGGPLDAADVDALIRLIESRRAGQLTVLVPPAHGDALRGQAIYDATCQKCHGDLATRISALSIVNPGFLASASDGFLAFAIKLGRPGTPMLGFATTLTDRQIGDVIQYLRSQQHPVPTPTPANVGGVPASPRRQAEADVQVILNPEGQKPTFTLRDDRFVSVDQVKAALDAKRRLVIVDARPVSEWIGERLAGAISIPYYQLDGIDRLPRDGTWIVAYCACPHHLSGIVVDALRARGFRNAVVLDEGIAVWKQRGHPMAGQLDGAPGPPE